MSIHAGKEAPTMRMPRVRFTLRGMMVAVAIVAAIVACEKSRRRWVEYRDWSRFYAKMEQEMIASADEPSGECGMAKLSSEQLGWLAAEQRAGTLRLAEYCGEMKAKYSRAMYFPWRPVAPDPPVPE